MTPLLLLFLAQAAGWTARPARPAVGDTVRLERVIAAPADARARLEAIAASDLLEPLDLPAAGYAEGAITLRYTVALFEPGRHAVPMPDVELLYLDGRTETVPGDTAWVTVASVLPAGDTLPAPQASLGPLRRQRRTSAPLALAVGASLAATGLWSLARRRRGPPLPAPAAPRQGPEPPVERWVAAGESRAVAAAVAERLRAVLARREPAADRSLGTEECVAAMARSEAELPVRDLTQVLRELERARFAPAVPSDVVAVVRRAEELRYLLEGAGAVEGA